ncbi:MAG: Unknown protein [uncultured Sulfurovum sp.]|uniref:AsmA-like C-terminal domain-containing protein n=1 Tax=uncultured Sulfurovum sp. TaxID=269237 RepID=A0A6S6RTH0_9BACT|nr:MAG: Unknown protein [uncultured Sulfurovum sp.]
MRVLVKYFFWLLSFFSLVIFYLLGTALGQVSLGCFVEDYYSEKMGNKIEVLSLKIEEYPKIVAEVRINDQALLSLNGVADQEDMNLNYHLRGNTFTWDNYIIVNPGDVSGKMQGKFSELHIDGKGKLFNGEIEYSFIRKANRLLDTELTLKDVDSKLLLDFLKYKDVLMGKIDVLMNFEYFSAYRRKGLVKVKMSKGMMPELSEEVDFALDAEIVVKDLLHEFDADIHSDIGKLRVANGHYNRAAKITTSDYGLHINELGYFEKFLKHKYSGPLNTAGSIKYDNGDLSLVGDSTSYGGVLEYDYTNDYLEIDFQGVSLEKFLRQLSFPPLLSSKIYGSATYDIKDEIILANTRLKETRFRRTKMTDTIYEMTGIDVLKDTYNDSLFTAGFQNNILKSLLKIDNGVNHLYLKNTRMNSKTNAVTADFEVQLDGQKFVGDIYGTLQDPKVNVDMSQLIQYQINKQIDSFFGTSKPSTKKNTEKNQVNNFQIENIERGTRSFLDGFFD